MLDFKDICLGDKPRFDSVINAVDPDGRLYPTADYTFGNLFIWKGKYSTRLAFSGGACFVSEKGGEYAFFPICSDGELPRALEALGATRFLFVTEDMLARLDAVSRGIERLFDEWEDAPLTGETEAPDAGSDGVFIEFMPED